MRKNGTLWRRRVKYKIEIDGDVRKQIKRLPGNVKQRIIRFINDLADNPRPSQAKHLRDHPNVWQHRIGNWRIVDDYLYITIIKIGKKHGPEFYDDIDFEDYE